MTEDARPVLLVEDNDDDAELTIRGLTRAHIEHPVDVARDGQEALDYLFGTDDQAPQRVPAVVLLDLKLPRIDGLDVLTRIRAEDRTRLVPVVILTSSSEDDDLINAYDLGASGYVIKPIQLDDFTRAIGQLGAYWLTINRPPPFADDDTAAGDLTAQHPPAPDRTRADPNPPIRPSIAAKQPSDSGDDSQNTCRAVTTRGSALAAGSPGFITCGWWCPGGVRPPRCGWLSCSW